MNLYVLIGIPGSGKSTYLKNFSNNEKNFIISSDSIRKEICGTEDDQSKNEEVFLILHERLDNAIKSQKYENIYVDTTAINQKNRNFYTKHLRSKYKRINLKLIALDFKINLEENIKRDLLRDRTVGEQVIFSMVLRYQAPTIEEGFDEIIKIHNIKKISENGLNEIDFLIEFLSKNYLGDVSNEEAFYNFFKNFENKLFQRILNCPQFSKYHQEDLFSHLTMITKLIQIDYFHGKINKNEFELLIITMLFHDIGKPLTLKRKFENLALSGKVQDLNDKTIFYNKKGESFIVENYNDIQFIGHEKVSSYIFENEFSNLNIDFEQFIKFGIINEIILEHLNFHLLTRGNNEEAENLLIGRLENKNKYSKNEIYQILKYGKMFSIYDDLGRIKI